MSVSLLLLGAGLCLLSQLSSALTVNCSLDNECEGQLITIPSDTVFDGNCQGYQSCLGAKLVVQSSSALGADFKCNGDTECCKNLTVVVFDSLLGFYQNTLNCASDAAVVDTCDDMNLTLVRAGISVVCESDTCDNLRVYLFDSQFTLYGASTKLQLFLDGYCNFNCKGDRSCFEANVVIAAGSELSADIVCNGVENCRGMELEVYDSDLDTVFGGKLDCNGYIVDAVDSCDDMTITLVRSSLLISCSDDECDGITVYLFDSLLAISVFSDGTAFAYGHLQVYLYGDSAVDDRRGVGQYIDLHYVTTTTPMPISTTPKPITTMALPTTMKPVTTETMALPSTTALPTTEEPVATESTAAATTGVEHSTAESTDETSTVPLNTTNSGGGSQGSDSTDNWLLVVAALAIATVCICGMCAFYWLWLKPGKVLKRNVAEVNETVDVKDLSVDSVLHGGSDSLWADLTTFDTTPGHTVVDARLCGEAPLRGGSEHVEAVDQIGEDSLEYMYEKMPETGGREAKTKTGPGTVMYGMKTTTGGMAMTAGYEERYGILTEMGDTLDESNVAAVLKGQMAAMATVGGGGEVEADGSQGEEDIEDMYNVDVGQTPGTRLWDIVSVLKVAAHSEEQIRNAQMLESAVALDFDTMQQEFEELSGFQLTNDRLIELLIDKANSVVMRVGAVTRA